jgi:predicted AAA+ superfamily ATPase
MMPYIKRKLEDQIEQSLSNHRALFILGARQVGKTTLLKRLIEQVGEERAVYFDLENSDHLHGLNGSIEDVVSYINSYLPQWKQRVYIFIDEIQYIRDFSSNIKYLVDHFSEKYKLIMTGSSSLLIKKSFSESLVGRKDVLELYPLSFAEYCLFKGEKRISEQLNNEPQNSSDALKVHQPKLNRMLKEYMLYGGYPQVVLSESREEKITLLRDIVNSYILKDVKYLFKIEKIDQFNHLIRYLAINIGKELSIKSIAGEIGLYWDTVQKHILALQESYIISLITPYHKNLTTELRQMPKVYFVDAGVRNTIINNFNDLDLRTDRGEQFENYVYNQLFLKKSLLTEIKYWKTRSGMEIDFVTINENLITAYEVKFGSDTKNNFAAFSNAYPDAQCCIVRFAYKKKENELPGWGM